MPAEDTWQLRTILRAMIPLLMVMAVVGVTAGSVLERFAEDFITNPALIVMLPIVIGMGGNLGAILATRLSAGLHMGRADPAVTDQYLLAHVLAVIALASTVSIVMGVVAHLIGNMSGAGTLSLFTTLQVAVATGLTLSLVVVLVGVGITLVSYRNGIDPDDTAIPVVTTVCDICGILILTGYTLLFV